MEPMVNQWTEPPHSMETTIMAVEYEGGVILGADSLTVWKSKEDFIAPKEWVYMLPIVHRTKSLNLRIMFIYVAPARFTGGFRLRALRYFLDQHTIQLGRPCTVKTAAYLVKELSYEDKSILETGLIVAGWDKYDGGSIYGIPLGGTMLRLPFATGGSGSSYLYGFLDQAWKPDMTHKEAEDLVVKSIALAIARDGASGGVVRTVTVNEQGVLRKFHPGDKLPLFHEESLLAPHPSVLRDALFASVRLSYLDTGRHDPNVK